MEAALLEVAEEFECPILAYAVHNDHTGTFGYVLPEARAWFRYQWLDDRFERVDEGGQPGDGVPVYLTPAGIAFLTNANLSARNP